MAITGTTYEAYEVVDKALNIELIKTEHVKELDSYGFTTNINGRKIVYTGDTCTLEPYKAYLNNCNEFYIDVSKFGGVHLKFEDIIEELKNIKENGTTIYLMHIDDYQYIKKLNERQGDVATVALLGTY